MANILDLIEQRLSNIEALLLDKHFSPPPNQSTSKQFLYGLAGLAEHLKCSHPTAQRIKNSLPKSAYTQAGRKIVFDVDAIQAALNKKG